MERNPDDRRADGTRTEENGEEDTPDYPVTKITKDVPDADRKAEPAKEVR